MGSEKQEKSGSSKAYYYQDGKVKRKTTSSFFRGEHANFLPGEEAFARDEVIPEYMVKGLMPGRPFIDKKQVIIAFGSCFADNIRKHLHKGGYNVANPHDDAAYISKMGDGIVNTFAIRQQFEWAWLNKYPQVELWHGYDGAAFGYDEAVRLKTRELLDQADVFIITLGVSEIWYDEPTGEVFWRAVPLDKYDASRHKFRVSSHAENLENIKATYDLIRKQRPQATIIFTVSPIPLTATFRNMACYSANAVSKAILRSAIDEFIREVGDNDSRLFYFPSYEIVLDCFNNPFLEDRKHVHHHILDFNMHVFERYFCESSLTDAEILSLFRRAQVLDKRVGTYGHWAVFRSFRERPGTIRKNPPFYFRLRNKLEALQHKIKRKIKK